MYVLIIDNVLRKIGDMDGDPYGSKKSAKQTQLARRGSHNEQIYGILP